MLRPLDKDAAFAAIVEDLELPLVLLSSPDPRVRLAMLDKIGAALLSTNLTWRDLTERVVAPRLPAMEPIVAVATPPIPPMANIQPLSETTFVSNVMLSNEELQSFGYHRSGRGYGYSGTPMPDPEPPQPGEV